MGYFQVLALILAVQSVVARRQNIAAALEAIEDEAMNLDLTGGSSGACPVDFWKAKSAKQLTGGSSAVKPIAITCASGKNFVLKPQNTKKMPATIDPNYHQLQEVAGAEVTNYITGGNALVPKPIIVKAEQLQALSAATGVDTTDWQAALDGSASGGLPARYAIIMAFFDGSELSDHIAELYNFQWASSDTPGVVVDLSSSSVACDPDTCEITAADGTAIPKQNGADMVRVSMKEDIPNNVLVQLFSHMLADYVIGNTDFHTENYLMGSSGSSVVALDKGQAFRYFRHSKTGASLDTTPWWDTTDGVTLQAYTARKNHEKLSFTGGQVPKKGQSRADPPDFCPFWHMNFQYQVLGAGNLPISGPLVTLLNSIRIEDPSRWDALVELLKPVVTNVRNLPRVLAKMPAVMAFGQLPFVTGILEKGGLVEEITRRSTLPLGISSKLCPVAWESTHIPAKKDDVTRTLNLLFS